MQTRPQQASNSIPDLRPPAPHLLHHHTSQSSFKHLVKFPTLANPLALYAPPITVSKKCPNCPIARSKTCPNLVLSASCHCTPVNVLLSPLTLAFPYAGSGLAVGTSNNAISAASAFLLVLRPCLEMRVVRTEVAVLGMRGLTAARIAFTEDLASRAADQTEMWCWTA